MSTGKHQDNTQQQLQLFGHDESAPTEVTASAFGQTQFAARVELRLVSNTTTAQQSKTEDLTAIDARLIGRAKYF